MPSDLIGGFAHLWDHRMEDTLRWARDLLGRFRYKPEWTFEMHRDQMGPMVAIRVMVPDSRHPDRPPSYTERSYTIMQGEPLHMERDDLIQISASFPIPIDLQQTHDEARFWHWLREQVLFVERHEADEWFRVDGQLPYDPHSPRRMMESFR